MPARFVIVGASLSGATAAVTLRHDGFDGEVVLIGAEDHLPYERPPLSKAFLRGEAPFEDALVRGEAFYRDNGVELVLGTRATGVDTERRVVSLEGGAEVGYDALLLATGARNRRFPIPGLDLERVHALRTIEDAAAIRAEMQPGRRAVIGGMGFIGSEVAASLRSAGVDVTAIDGGTVPLERVLGPDVGGVLRELHVEHGVRIVGGDRVAAFEGAGRVERVVTAGGVVVECDFAVVGLGVEPVTDLAAPTTIAVDNGILVDELCRTNVEGVFACGDVANHQHPLFGRLRTEHWQNARHQGAAAARSMLGKGSPYDDVHWFWSEQYDAEVQYAGYHREWDELVIRGRLEERDFVGFYVKDGRVRAVVAMNRPRDVRAAMALIAEGGLADPQALRDEDVALGSLA